MHKIKIVTNIANGKNSSLITCNISILFGILSAHATCKGDPIIGELQFTFDPINRGRNVLILLKQFCFLHKLSYVKLT